LTESRLLIARGLVKTFRSGHLVARTRNRLPALDGVSLTLDRGESLGLVGESGSGKSTLAHCLVRIVEPDAGTIQLDGDDLLAARGKRLQAARRRLQLVYQDPYSSLNPRLTVQAAIVEPARVHGIVQKAEEREYAVRLVQRVGLGEDVLQRRPKELSGGQRQRVAIARALALKPDLLIGDEALSALDVSVQAQILNLFGALQEDLGVGLLLISHQLSVVAHLADNVAVMYLGRIVESGPTTAVFRTPRHPYTAALLEAQPRLSDRGRRRPALRGELPTAESVPTGCRFRSRCPLAERVCAEVDPPAVEVAPGHFSRCHVLAPAASSLRTTPSAIRTSSATPSR
jgi:oligopeptide transport system ATP-binding protein